MGGSWRMFVMLSRQTECQNVQDTRQNVSCVIASPMCEDIQAISEECLPSLIVTSVSPDCQSPAQLSSAT